MSNELSFEKSGGLGNTPCVNAKISTSTPTHDVEDRLHEERGGDRRIARAGNRGAREEQLDDVPAARGHDVVEADRREVRAPDAPPLEADRRIGGAQAVEVRARAQRQVEPEEHQPQQQRPPMDGREVGEELPGGIEERREAFADRGRCKGRCKQSRHSLKRTGPGASGPRDPATAPPARIPTAPGTRLAERRRRLDSRRGERSGRWQRCAPSTTPPPPQPAPPAPARRARPA